MCAAGGVSEFFSGPHICPAAARGLSAWAGCADPHSMEIQGTAALMIQANALDAVRSTLSAAQATPPTPEAHAQVILELSSAAQALMTTSR